MPSEDDYRSQAEALLRLAAAADNMRDRSRLIDEAMHWHNRAVEVREGIAESGEEPGGRLAAAARQRL
jgi:hypothetical protein